MNKQYNQKNFINTMDKVSAIIIFILLSDK